VVYVTVLITFFEWCEWVFILKLIHTARRDFNLLRQCRARFGEPITQACDQKTFLTRVAVSYAFFRADNGKNSEKVPSRTIFAQISIFNFGTQWITTGC